MIGRRPEAPQIVGDLDRTEVRAEQVQDHRDPTGGETGRVGPSEEFLKANGQHRRAIRFVAERNPAAAGDDQGLGGLLVHGLSLGVGQSPEKQGDERDAAHLVQGAAAA